MVYTVFYKTSSSVGYCFLSRYSIHPQRHDVFSFMLFEATLVKIQICSFIAADLFPRGVLFFDFVYTHNEKYYPITIYKWYCYEGVHISDRQRSRMVRITGKRSLAKEYSHLERKSLFF